MRRFVFLAIVASTPLAAQQRREPLPLDVAVNANAHNGRSSFNLSPDGQWIAHTYERPEQVERDSPYYSATGFPFGEGGSRMQAALTNTRSGEMTRLGGSKGVSWAPVWSPDGKRVAFFADDDGQAGVWIWERATGKAQRVPGVIARPFFGFEYPRWSADGQRVLVKLLPEGMTIAQANALTPKRDGERQYPASKPDEPTVLVLSAKAVKPADSTKAASRPQSSAFADRSIGDLAMIDVASKKVTRIVRRGHVLWYAFSPDQKSVAYSQLKGFIPNSQQPGYDLAIYDVASGASRLIGTELPMSYGIEASWAPDSRRVAYIRSGSMSRGEMVVITVADSSKKNLGSPGIPSFDQGDGEFPPLWDSSGSVLYAVSQDGKLWRVDIATGQGKVVGDLPNQTIRTMVESQGRSQLWTTDGGRTAWAITREKTGDRAGIFRIDLQAGTGQAALQEKKSISAVFNVDASSASGDIAFVAKDQQHLPDVWAFSTSSGAARQVTHLNPEMERYELGTSRLIDYRGLDGQALRAALLLPPGYQPGTKLPTLVWVYGGSMGSNYVNSFGFWGDIPTFNMHVLATRGYAVLFPDAPLKPGTPMKDLLNTVMPAVNAAIEQGYADPERLAVSGQSYGSYSSLALITQTTRFKAAIITAAVLHPDLFSAYLEMAPDGMATGIGYYEQGQGGMGGNIWEQRDRYFDNSPLFLFDKVQTPLLIGQGDKDGRLVASDAMFVGLRRLGKEVEYRIYKDEEHVIQKRPNVIDFWKRRIEFLDEHLAPKKTAAQ